MNFEDAIKKLLNYSDRRIMSTTNHVNFIIEKTKNIKKYVECGVAKGGVCALIALHNQNCKIYALDAWAGMPNISDKDESHLKKFVGKTNIYGDEKIVVDSFNLINAPTNNLKIIKGWVEDTIPLNNEELKDIDFLRIDVDWHDPILFVLEKLYFNIKKGGIVLLDDGVYKGCRTAVETFRQKYNITNTIYRGIEYGCDNGCQFWWIV